MMLISNGAFSLCPAKTVLHRKSHIILEVTLLVQNSSAPVVWKTFLMEGSSTNQYQGKVYRKWTWIGLTSDYYNKTSCANGPSRPRHPDQNFVFIWVITWLVQWILLPLVVILSVKGCHCSVLVATRITTQRWMHGDQWSFHWELNPGTSTLVKVHANH